MNRTDRLFALLLELRGNSQDGGWTQAEDLAKTFGVSVRTIYRDVLALGESGVPVVSVPGKGYTLLDGYLLPSLHFTPQEATMLMLGADAMQGAFDAEYAGAASTALKKLSAALPEPRRGKVEHLRAHLRIIRPDEGQEAESLRLLRGAVLGQRPVQFMYHKPGVAPQQRLVYPLTLVHLNGVWMLGVFDPLRGERRVFRLSRIEQITVQAQPFQRDPSWQVGPQPELERRDIRVRLSFPRALQRQLRERPNFFQTATKELGETLEVTLQVRQLADIWSWLLSWGAAVRVLAPTELREMLHAEAKKMLESS